MIPKSAPRMMALRVNSGRTCSSGTYGLKFFSTVVSSVMHNLPLMVRRGFGLNSHNAFLGFRYCVKGDDARKCDKSALTANRRPDWRLIAAPAKEPVQWLRAWPAFPIPTSVLKNTRDSRARKPRILSCNNREDQREYPEADRFA